ncbi:hypothetical protein D3C72_2348870 [compost metagenome]
MPNPGLALMRGHDQFPYAGQCGCIDRRKNIGLRMRCRQHALAQNAARDPPVHQQPHGFVANVGDAEAKAVAAIVVGMLT